jgi:uncharacterized membrane protein
MSTPPPIPGPSSERSSTGLDANVAGALAYLLGFVSGIALLVLEKDSTFVKFHAMQSTIVSVLWIVGQAVFTAIPFIGWFLLLPIWWALGVILWVFLMFKAFQGERYKLPYLGDIAEQQVSR